MQTLSAVKFLLLHLSLSGSLLFNSPPLISTIAWLQLSFDVDVKQVDISNPQFSSSNFVLTTAIVLVLVLYDFLSYSFLNSLVIFIFY